MGLHNHLLKSDVQAIACAVLETPWRRRADCVAISVVDCLGDSDANLHDPTQDGGLLGFVKSARVLLRSAARPPSPIASTPTQVSSNSNAQQQGIRTPATTVHAPCPSSLHSFGNPLTLSLGRLQRIRDRCTEDFSIRCVAKHCQCKHMSVEVYDH